MSIYGNMEELNSDEFEPDLKEVLTEDMGHREYGIALCGSDCPYKHKYCTSDEYEFDVCPVRRAVIQKLGILEHETSEYEKYKQENEKLKEIIRDFIDLI